MSNSAAVPEPPHVPGNEFGHHAQVNGLVDVSNSLDTILDYTCAIANHLQTLLPYLIGDTDRPMAKPASESPVTDAQPGWINHTDAQLRAITIYCVRALSMIDELNAFAGVASTGSPSIQGG